MYEEVNVYESRNERKLTLNTVKIKRKFIIQNIKRIYDLKKKPNKFHKILELFVSFSINNFESFYWTCVKFQPQSGIDIFELTFDWA